jgi:hypothetical protein
MHEIRTARRSRKLPGPGASAEQQQRRWATGTPERGGRRLTGCRRARQAASDGVGRVLEAVGAASGIVRQLQQHYARAVAPRVEESAAEAAACATGLASLVRAVEERVLAALQASLSAFFVQARARRRARARARPSWLWRQGRLPVRRAARLGRAARTAPARC